jgi:hypothetical protein
MASEINRDSIGGKHASSGHISRSGIDTLGFTEPDSTGTGEKRKGAWHRNAWEKVKKVLDKYGLTPSHIRFWGIAVLGLGLVIKNDHVIAIGTTATITGEISAAKRGESAVNKLLTQTRKDKK